MNLLVSPGACPASFYSACAQVVTLVAGGGAALIASVRDVVMNYQHPTPWPVIVLKGTNSIDGCLEAKWRWSGEADFDPVDAADKLAQARDAAAQRSGAAEGRLPYVRAEDTLMWWFVGSPTRKPPQPAGSAAPSPSISLLLFSDTWLRCFSHAVLVSPLMQAIAPEDFERAKAEGRLARAEERLVKEHKLVLSLEAEIAEAKDMYDWAVEHRDAMEEAKKAAEKKAASEQRRTGVSEQQRRTGGDDDVRPLQASASQRQPSGSPPAAAASSRYADLLDAAAATSDAGHAGKSANIGSEGEVDFKATRDAQKADLARQQALYDFAEAQWNVALKKKQWDDLASKATSDARAAALEKAQEQVTAEKRALEKKMKDMIAVRPSTDNDDVAGGGNRPTRDAGVVTTSGSPGSVTPSSSHHINVANLMDILVRRASPRALLCSPLWLRFV